MMNSCGKPRLSSLNTSSQSDFGILENYPWKRKKPHKAARHFYSGMGGIEPPSESVPNPALNASSLFVPVNVENLFRQGARLREPFSLHPASRDVKVQIMGHEV